MKSLRRYSVLVSILCGLVLGTALPYIPGCRHISSPSSVTEATPAALENQGGVARDLAPTLTTTGAEAVNQAGEIDNQTVISDKAADQAAATAPAVKPHTEAVKAANKNIRVATKKVAEGGKVTQAAAPVVESLGESIDNSAEVIKQLQADNAKKQAEIDSLNSWVDWVLRVICIALIVWGGFVAYGGITTGMLSTVGRGGLLIAIGVVGLLCISLLAEAEALIHAYKGWVFAALAVAAGLCVWRWIATHKQGTRWKAFGTSASIALEAAKKGVVLSADELRDHMGEDARALYQEIAPKVIKETNHLIAELTPAPAAAPAAPSPKP